MSASLRQRPAVTKAKSAAASIRTDESSSDESPATHTRTTTTTTIQPSVTRIHKLQDRRSSFSELDDFADEFGRDGLLAKSKAILMSPDFLISFLFLLAARTIYALYMPIQDCDETFNYWEPLHYLLYGRGLQTWEYSPVYALRSYFFLYPYSLLVALLELSGISIELAPYQLSALSKIGAFYGLRLFIGIISAYAEARLINAISLRFQRGTSVLTLFFLLFSPGMGHASISLLPQTFTMICLMHALESWLLHRYRSAIVWHGIAALIGWPFSALLALPIGLEIAYRYRKKLYKPIFVAIATTVVTIGLSVLTDHHYYRRTVIAVWNISIYNSNQSSSGGSNLYGVEPASYYIANLFLNFNLTAVLAFLAPVLSLLGHLFVQQNPQFGHSLSPISFLRYISSSILWLAAMFLMPHKEERFLYVIYPAITFAGAHALIIGITILTYSLRQLLFKARSSSFGQNWGSFSTFLVSLVCIGSLVLSMGRTFALIYYYSAPLKIYSELARQVATTANTQLSTPFPVNFEDVYPTVDTYVFPTIVHQPPKSYANVCVGKEWYRFPSHFFLPTVNGVAYRLQFLDGGFRGLLPRAYLENNETYAHRNIGTSVVPPHQNDQNREEPERYVKPEDCEYIVDMPLDSQQQQHYSLLMLGLESETPGCKRLVYFNVVHSASFLDMEATPKWTRSFHYGPFALRPAKYLHYELLKRVSEESCIFNK